MNVNRAEDLARGMQLIPQLPEVMLEQADERIRPIYEDIRATLRVPFVNFIFRTLANYPQYVESTWYRISPSLRTRAFERAADDVRSQALLEPVPNVSDVDWRERANLDRIRSFTDSIHYILLKLLLIASAFDEGLQGRRPQGGSAESRGRAVCGGLGGDRDRSGAWWDSDAERNWHALAHPADGRTTG